MGLLAGGIAIDRQLKGDGTTEKINVNVDQRTKPEILEDFEKRFQSFIEKKEQEEKNKKFEEFILQQKIKSEKKRRKPRKPRKKK